MEEPADTLNYMIAGFTVIFSIMAIYLASLVVRWHHLRKDAQVMKELDEEE